MKSLATVIVISLSLCGVFTPTNGLSCYKCDWKDAQCATELSDSKLKTIDCAKLGTSLSDLEGDSSGDANSTVTTVKTDADFHCFKASLKANDTTVAVVRGCKSSGKNDDCLPDALTLVDSCVVCNTDNCNGNGQSKVTGSEVQCALISSLLIARMFFLSK